MRVFSAIFVGVAALVIAPLLAQSPGPGPQQRPSFRSSITIVPVDVRVVDAAGKPVTDLKQEDFTLKEDGVLQTIRHFTTQQFTADPAAAAAAVAPDVRIGQPPEMTPQNRRVFLLVLGRGRHQDVSKYIDSLARFIREQTLPQDQVAVLAWNRATDFTTDHATVSRLIERYRDGAQSIEADLALWFSGLRALYGSKEIPPHIQKKIDAVFGEVTALRPRPLAPAPTTDAQRINQDFQRTAFDIQRNAEIEDRLMNGFRTLPDPMAARIAGPYGPISFDEYIDRSVELMQDVGNLYAGVGYLRFLEGEKHLVFLTGRGVSLPDQSSNASLARVAADARIALDVVQTGGVDVPKAWSSPTTFSTVSLGQISAIQDLRLMTDRTGGQLMAFRTGADAFRRLEDSMRFQYLLGYTPTDPTLNEKFRKISISVNRPGVRVFVREGYVAAGTPVMLDRRQMITFNRIRAAAEYVNVIDHLKLTLGPPTVAGKDLSLDVTVNISKVKFASQGDRQEAVLDVALFIGGEDDRPVGEAQKRVELRLGPEAFARAQQQGTTFRLSAPVSGVARRIKVVVYDYGADLVGSAVAKVK